MDNTLFDLVHANFTTLDPQLASCEALRYTAQLAAEMGVTTLHAFEGGSLFSDEDIPILLEIQDSLPVHIALYWGAEDCQQIMAAGLIRQGGDILLDGSIGSRTAAFREPYADDPSTCGVLYFSNQRVEAMIEAAHLHGLQIGFHVIGEKAISQALHAFQNVLARYPQSDHRHRLEHFGFPSERDLALAAELGLVISTQPAFTYLRGGPGKVYNQRLGDARERNAYPLRRMLDAGLVVNGGSDSDVTPINPILGIHAAVNPPYIENAILPAEALQLFTTQAARTIFSENIQGSIEIGKLADLTILSADPLQTRPDKIKDIQVWMTIKAGEIVHQSPHFQAFENDYRYA